MVQKYEGTNNIEAEKLHHNQAVYNMLGGLFLTPLCERTSLQCNHRHMVFSNKICTRIDFSFKIRMRTVFVRI